MTAYGTVATAVEAMKLGAFDYIQKPFSTEELLVRLARAVQFHNVAKENRDLRRALSATANRRLVAGQSEAMKRVLDRIHALAGFDTTVLIEGESGTGKELVAHTLHETSHFSGGPFVAVSCAALPKELIESELFGHEAGAFTGAAHRRIGRFEAARGGTIFLDDVDDIPLGTQVKLLRVLQERSVERIGAHTPEPVHLRVVAATKQSLRDLIAEGKFREDLYFRLAVVPLRLPPLRERPEDIPALVEHFLERLALKTHREHLCLTPAAVKRMQQYHWPGNVRELEHLLEQMVTLSDKHSFDVEDIPDLQRTQEEVDVIRLGLDQDGQVDLADVLTDVERRLVRWAMDKTGGNLARAAELLGVPRSTLQYKISKLEDHPLHPSDAEF
jgi:DNA-binding NtrC family response regulator